MRIAMVAAGAAGMYCGTCLHDNTLAAALLAAGHEVALLPTYTPLRTDEENVSFDGVFFGAVNVYLQQASFIFRRTPRFLDRLLDHPAVLSWASRRAGSTDARRLGALTLSILRGERGRQGKELARLVAWLAAYRPDVVQLSNSMFLGFAAEIRRATGAAVVCALTGEDLFLEGLSEPHRGRVYAELRRRAGDADRFVATSGYYALRMAELLAVEADRVEVVPLGIRLDEGAAPWRTREPGGPLVLGYLARICPEKGLHVLVEAFREARERRPAVDLRLRVAGYLGPRDRAYLAELRRRLDEWGLSDAVEIVGEVDRAGKLAFLRGLDLLSVPATYREPKGLYVLEALAQGVPVVEPRHGAFPELLEASGGGLLVEPDSPTALAAGILRLADDPALRRELGRRGREAVERAFTDRVMARATAEAFERARGGRRRAAS